MIIDEDAIPKRVFLVFFRFVCYNERMIHSNTEIAKIKEIMKAKGVTTVALAKETGIVYGTLSTWFSGNSRFDPSKKAHCEALDKMCAVLGVDPNTLVSTVSEARAEYKVSPGRNVLEILLTTIENANAPKQQREDAKNIIREWLKDLV
jgi:transcriptional regulator with XRE-family HTH domain